MTLIYDGSFEGFLTLVYDVYYQKLQPKSIIKTKNSNFIFDDSLELITDENKSQKVAQAIKNKFPKDNLQTIYNCFLCDCYDFEDDLLAYIKIGFTSTHSLQNINIQPVKNICDMENELLRIAHKMKGFLRFEELDDGTLYAKFENKFNVLIFLAKHFLMRLNNQKFIIHDIKRNIAFIKNEALCSILNIDSYEMPTLSQNEEDFKKLWKTFFNSITIKSRQNYKLQRSQVPLIYRNYMSEFN